MFSFKIIIYASKIQRKLLNIQTLLKFTHETWFASNFSSRLIALLLGRVTLHFSSQILRANSLALCCHPLFILPSKQISHP